MPITTLITDAEIDAIAAGVVDRTLPKPAWTHAAHFAAALWLLRHRGLEATLAEMPDLIRRYNEATGVPNTDTDGYHETITLASIRAGWSVLAAHPPDAPLCEVASALLAGPFGGSRWPLAYWSGELLFTPLARRTWVEPDLRALPF
jgi:hypothetical protein